MRIFTDAEIDRGRRALAGYRGNEPTITQDAETGFLEITWDNERTYGPVSQAYFAFFVDE